MTAGAWPSAAPARGRAQVDHYLPLIARVLAQSERRVLHGQVVPASDKLVSLFEPHADIIVKGTRDVQYGHKLNLVTGKSGLILDIAISNYPFCKGNTIYGMPRVTGRRGRV